MWCLKYTSSVDTSYFDMIDSNSSSPPRVFEDNNTFCMPRPVLDIFCIVNFRTLKMLILITRDSYKNIPLLFWRPHTLFCSNTHAYSLVTCESPIHLHTALSNGLPYTHTPYPSLCTTTLSWDWTDDPSPPIIMPATFSCATNLPPHLLHPPLCCV